MLEGVQVKATSRTLRRVLADPITWSPLLPFAAAYSFLGAPWWACTAGAAAAGAGIFAWWRSRWNVLCREAEMEVVREECAKSNARLENAVATFSRRFDGGKGSAEIHRLVANAPAFLASKRSIENAILEDDRISGVEAEIATMVADLSSAWIVDLGRLEASAPGSAEFRRLVEALEKGIAVMERTRAEIDLLIRPSRGMMPAMESAASDRAHRLEERLAEAHKIRNRLEQDLKTVDVEPQPGRLMQ